MLSLDFALCHWMVRLAAGVAHAPPIEPVGELSCEIRGPIVTEQTWSLLDGYLVKAGRLQRQVQCRRDIGCCHGGAELEGDDLAREVVEDGRRVIPVE